MSEEKAPQTIRLSHETATEQPVNTQPQPMQQPAPQAEPQYMPQTQPQYMPQAQPQQMPQAQPQQMPQAQPQYMPEGQGQQMPYGQQTPQINVVVNSSPQAVAGAGAGGPAVVMMKQKSMFLALLLAFFFGPLGMLYSTITGAIVMFLVNLILIIPTAGLITFLTWPLGLVWAGVAVSSYNNRGVRI
jgi:hypothetical protein